MATIADAQAAVCKLEKLHDKLLAGMEELLSAITDELWMDPRGADVERYIAGFRQRFVRMRAVDRAADRLQRRIDDSVLGRLA